MEKDSYLLPAIIVDFDTKQMMEISLLENIQRQDLTPMEEANAYNQLIEKLGYTTPHKPKIGNVGKALMEASKENKDCEWAKKQLDTMFTKLRKENKKERKNYGKRKK